MEKFVWTNKYSLGIGIIDEQHHHFFDIVNRIYDMLEKKGDHREEIITIVGELKEHAFYHLATEEKYFNQFAYSDIANHMKAHTAFRLKTEEYSNRIENKDEDFSLCPEIRRDAIFELIDVLGNFRLGSFPSSSRAKFMDERAK